MKEIVEKMPSIMIERPKMPRATWEALRAHIVRERLKKKQEQEQNQEFERQKKERENRKKQEALTLEETKEQIAQLETQLNQHKEEKHQLFHTLKKVLYEDETKRRSEEVPQPHLYLQPSSRPGGSGHGPAASIYMKPHPHILMAAPGTAANIPAMPQQASSVNASTAPSPQPGSKRPNSPSPVRTAAYYRPPSGPGLAMSGAPKYVVYTTQSGGGGQLPPTSIYSSAPATGASAPRPAHMPAHYSSYPGAAAASIHHSRLAEDERTKQQQHQQQQQQQQQQLKNLILKMSLTRIQHLARSRLVLGTLTRNFSCTTVNGYPVHPVYLKLKEKQKAFQVDNGLRIHERGGTKDKILYNFTLGITGVCLVMVLHFFYTSMFPKKPEN